MVEYLQKNNIKIYIYIYLNIYIWYFEVVYYITLQNLRQYIHISGEEMLYLKFYFQLTIDTHIINIWRAYHDVF